MLRVMSCRRALKVAGVVVSMLALSGCGTNPGDRAVSGAALGAGVGALFGAAAGNPATGAAIGALGGTALGLATDPCDLDLGTPYWRDHGGRRAYDRRCRNGHYSDRDDSDRDNLEDD